MIKKNISVYAIIQPNIANQFLANLYLDSFTFFTRVKLLFTYNHGHKILEFSNVLPNFLSSQVKRSVIISNKHGIYELPHELPNELRLRIFHLKKLGNIRKISKRYRIIAYYPVFVPK